MEDDIIQSPCKIIILGTKCSGKKTVQNLLIKQFGLEHLTLPSLTNSLEKTSPLKIDTNKYGGITDLCYNQYNHRGVFLMKDVNSKALKHIKQRNFINVLFIDAPFSIRYQFAKNKYPEITIQQFAQQDLAQYTEDYQKCIEFARVKIYNKGTIQQLKQIVYSKKDQIIRRFRPSWDQYFMKIADIARRRSNCMKSAVGAVIVNENNRVISTGYNGTPQGMISCFKGGCKRCNNNESKGLDECLCLHGEQSAIIQVGINRTQGCRLYTTLYPCFSCAKIIKQAKIKKIYYMDPYLKVDSGQKFLKKNFKEEDVVQIKIDNLYY